MKKLKVQTKNYQVSLFKDTGKIVNKIIATC